MPTRVLSDEQLQELLGLLRGADSAELKLTIPEDAQGGVLRALGIDPLDARIREVFFFDTPEFSLDRPPRVHGRAPEAAEEGRLPRGRTVSTARRPSRRSRPSRLMPACP